MAIFTIADVMEKVKQAAHLAREDARYGGRMDDGGAREMLMQVEYYQYGMARAMPPEWQRFANELTCERDPEWSEYRRLREKFEGR